LLSQKWDLDVIFPGGSGSPELETFLTALEADIAAFKSRVAATAVPTTVDAAGPWTGVLDTLQDLAKRFRQAAAYVSCLNAQNTKDEKAKLLSGRLGQMGAAFGSVSTLVDAQILELPEAVFAALVAQPQFQAIAYPLAERRRRANEKMGVEKESLVGDLSVDGYHAWGHLYNTIVGRTTVPFQGKDLSVGQAFNKMSDGNRQVRADVFAGWEKAWGDQAELIGAALNHLAGYRINLYKHRGWENVLREPLDTNRMTPDTLNVMWSVIDQNKHHLVKYLQRKAQLLGLDGLTWYDVDAPLSSSTTAVTYDEAAAFIVEQFRKFSPRMADFARMAFDKSWIEAEDRPGKRPGGFCTSFPVAQESRVFMTFAGTMGNVSTLAHELGHAYHQSVMNDLPQMAQGYAMNVAETASTFAEMIVADAALKAAPTKEERIALLADKIERAVAFFMNIHARFLFETRFYAERKKGLLSVERLNELMVTAQKEAFRDSLTEYHPLFWASKLHFYSTGQPFYNFPYTFGYLFSSGVYARAMAEGPAFEQKYVDLLRDTGRMMVEDLAARHLGVDLTKPEFWQAAVDLVIADVEEFMALTK
jgi:oligoendopeptidase F